MDTEAGIPSAGAGALRLGIPARAPRIGLIIVLALAAGYAVYRFIQISVGFLWVDVPANVFGGRVPWFYVILIPLAAGLLVSISRSRGSDGHNPLYGFAKDPVRPREFPTTIANILISLVGGLVLGPEMALVATGSVIGASLSGGSTGRDLYRWSGIGALAALAALAVDPIRTGHLDFSEGYSFSAADLPLSVGAGILSVLVIAAVRVGAFGLMRVRGGDRPVAWQMALGGATVGGLALAYQAAIGQPIDMVLTSGEQMIKPLVAMDSAGLIATTVLVKSLCYMISMGSGFRGGPYFPVMFAGAGVGAVVGLLTTGSTVAPGVAGLLAATVFLAKPPWPAVLLLGVIVGIAFGGFAMLPAAIIGAVIGQLIPRMGEPSMPTAPPDKPAPPADARC